jgi:transcriptional regulator with XRE-family HTH domain
MDDYTYKIKTALKQAGVRQIDIARMLKITPVSVHDVVIGKRRNPRIRKAISLATGRPESELWPESKEQAA